MKFFKLFILLMSLSVALSSCGIIIINRTGDETQAAESEREEITYIPETRYPIKDEPDYEADASERVNALPDMDFGGLSVLIAVAEETGDFFSDVEGGYVSSALKRNTLIADKYNTLIVTDIKDSATLLNEVAASDKSNDFYADFAVIRSADIGAYYDEGYLQNLLALSYIDLDKEYFNADGIDQMTLGGVIYGAVGSMTEAPENFACLFFNKTLGKSLGVTADYSSVYNHTFTWDKLLTQLASVDTVTPALTSSYGIDRLSRLSFLSAGQNYLGRDGDGDFVSVFNNGTTESIIDIMKTAKDVITDKYVMTAPSVDENGSETATEVMIEDFDIFSSGNALYSFGYLSDMSKIANCGFDFEVLPLPKLTEDGEYRAAMGPDAPVVTVLNTSPNIDTNGYILQALGAASYEYMYSSYVRHVLNSYATGIYTADMIDLITENPIYDHAEMFGSEYSRLRNGTYVCLTDAVESTKNDLEYYVKKSKTNLNKYLNAIN